MCITQLFVKFSSHHFLISTKWAYVFPLLGVTGPLFIALI